jgi:hypothetical protein
MGFYHKHDSMIRKVELVFCYGDKHVSIVLVGSLAAVEA